MWPLMLPRPLISEHGSTPRLLLLLWIPHSTTDPGMWPQTGGRRRDTTRRRPDRDEWPGRHSIADEVDVAVRPEDVGDLEVYQQLLCARDEKQLLHSGIMRMSLLLNRPTPAACEQPSRV